MEFRLLSLLILALAGFSGQATAKEQAAYLQRDEAAPATSLRVSNHHQFPIREIVQFQLPADLANSVANLLAVSHSVSGGTVEAHYLPIQLEPDPEGEAVNAWIDVQSRAGESRVYTFQDVGGGSSSKPETKVTDSFSNGLPATIAWNPESEVKLFDLVLLEIVDELESLSSNRIRKGLDDPLEASFELQQAADGPVKSTFTYRATASGRNDYEILVRYDLSSSGITDVEVRVQTSELRSERGYLALGKRISSPAEEGAALQAKGSITTPVQRDSTSRIQSVNWFSWGDLEGETNRAILAEATPNLTRLRGNHYVVANSRLVNESILGAENEWVMLSEISRGNLPGEEASEAFVLPTTDEPVILKYRLLPSKKRSLDEVNQAFVSFAGYQSRHLEEEEFQVSFGVSGVRFGNNYSPHTTFGEDWHLFKDEIRRDMRIANTLGVEWIRIQNFNAPEEGEDYLSTENGKWMVEYLEFMAETAWETDLRIFLEFSLSPSDLQLVAERLGDVIGFYELDRDALRQGIPVNRIDQWRDLRDALTSARPDAFLTAIGGARSFSLFDRLDHLGLDLDAIGQRFHEEEKPSLAAAADDAIFLGGYSTRVGKTAFLSGDNWRMSARDTEDRQAGEFFTISDRILSQRSVPLLLLASLTETDTTFPRAGDDMRNYEPLRLDRTPKVQARAYHEIIRRYGRPDNRIKTLDVSLPLLTIRPGEQATIPVTVKNLTTRPLEIRLNTLLPDGLSSEDDAVTLTLRPRQSQSVQRTIRAADDLAPGVYHIFEEARFDDTTRLGWAYASHRAAPPLDLETEPPEGVHYAGGLEELQRRNLANLRHVVYGRSAPAREVDVALHLHNTLRSATGANIHRWPHDQIDEDQRKRSILLVGNQKTNPLVAEISDRLPINPLELPPGEGAVMVVEHTDDPSRFLLIVSGKDVAGTEKAASDLLVRYWRNAKDAVER